MTPETRRRVAMSLLVPLMLFGIAVGFLMTWHHDTQLYGGPDARGELIGCTESATVNCDIVNTSEWSELFGVPIATLAIGAYGTVLVLAVASLRGRDSARTLVAVAGGIAVLCSAFLFYQSKIELGYVCAWCLRLYGVNAGIVGLAALAGRSPLPDRTTVLTFGLALLGSLAIAAVGERVYRSTLHTGAAPTVAAAPTERGADPKGSAPSRSFDVTTEANKATTFSLDPDDAWIGNPDAKVTVVMFGDLECGFCKRSSAELDRLEATYADRVLFVFKHFPMDPACNPGVQNRKHKSACGAAKAAVCAQQQGVFWKFHDLAYKNQHQLDPEYLRTYAKLAGADPAKFDACFTGTDAEQVVRHDAEVGASLDIHGTPRIFINGKLYRSGSSAEVMAREIETQLGTSGADADRNAAALRETTGAIQPIPANVPATRSLTFADHAFEMDTFEDAVKDGVAVSEKHEIPALRQSWFDADAACKKASKRLCTEQEWVSACQNAPAVDDNGNGQFADDMIEGTAYPYGDYHDDGRCWDGHDGDPATSGFRPVYTGEMPGCVTPTGIYDLTGNVEEWVGESPDKAVLLGGAWDTAEDHARCYRRDDSFGAGYSSVRTGFRCCR